MTDPLTRRGFARIALAGAASLWLPDAARADVPPRLVQPRLTLRIAAVAGAAAIEVVLSLRNEGERGLEVPADALHLAGVLLHGAEVVELSFSPKRRPAPMPRSGPRLTRRIHLARARTTPYAAFTAPCSLAPGAGGAVVRVQSRALHIARASLADRAALSALDGLAAETRLRG